MGYRLAIWDWMSGTLFISKGVNQVSFGLGWGEDSKYETVSQNMINSFLNNITRIKCWLS